MQSRFAMASIVFTGLSENTYPSTGMMKVDPILMMYGEDRIFLLAHISLMTELTSTESWKKSYVRNFNIQI